MTRVRARPARNRLRVPRSVPYSGIFSVTTVIGVSVLFRTIVTWIGLPGGVDATIHGSDRLSTSRSPQRVIASPTRRPL